MPKNSPQKSYEVVLSLSSPHPTNWCICVCLRVCAPQWALHAISRSAEVCSILIASPSHPIQPNTLAAAEQGTPLPYPPAANRPSFSRSSFPSDRRLSVHLPADPHQNQDASAGRERGREGKPTRAAQARASSKSSLAWPVV